MYEGTANVFEDVQPDQEFAVRVPSWIERSKQKDTAIEKGHGENE